MARPRSDGSRWKVLLVEDDPGDAFLIQELLMDANAGLDLVIAGSLPEALERISGASAVILDLGLPGVSGLAAVQAITAVDAHLPVIVLTGYEDYHAGQTAVTAGAADYLVKGVIDSDALYRSIQYAVRQATMSRELHELRVRQAELRRGSDLQNRPGRLPDAARSSCLLIGASSYAEAARYPGLPAVKNNLYRLASVLADPKIGGFARDRIYVEHNPSQAVGARIAEISEQTDDVLLVYYAGHGVLDQDGQLYLGLPAIQPGREWCTGLPYQWIRRAINSTPAAARVVILDNCFSGMAIDETMSDPESSVGLQLQIRGAYTLTSTSGTSLARAPKNDRYTAFTGELIALLSSGLPGRGPLLHITSLYSPLADALMAKRCPLPHQRGTDTIGDLALVRNAAHHPAPDGFEI